MWISMVLYVSTFYIVLPFFMSSNISKLIIFKVEVKIHYFPHHSCCAYFILSVVFNQYSTNT